MLCTDYLKIFFSWLFTEIQQNWSHMYFKSCRGNALIITTHSKTKNWKVPGAELFLDTKQHIGIQYHQAAAFMKALHIPAWVCSEPSQEHLDTWLGLSAAQINYTWIMESHLSILQDHYPILIHITYDNPAQAGFCFADPRWQEQNLQLNVNTDPHYHTKQLYMQDYSLFSWQWNVISYACLV